MSFLDRIKDSAGTGATILGFIGIIGSVAAYGTNLKNQFDASQTKIVQLESQVSTLRDQLDKSYSLGAVKGEKGDPGPPGPPGERGPKGDPGTPTTINKDELYSLVQELVAQEFAKAPKHKDVSNFPSESATDPGYPECRNASDARKSQVLSLRHGDEFCEKDGKIVARVSISQADGKINIKIPGNFYEDHCSTDQKCTFKWLGGRKYIYERYQRGDEGITSQLRASD